ncbi:MAG: hypothetical protein GX666_08615 [Tissierellia bacterium]|nr:hypothetical protein [Tissierellia bacterium]
MAKNMLTVLNNWFLKKPGDNLSARVTKTNRRVFKIATDNGNNKYSITQYDNGTVVETKTTKFPKKKP